MSNEMPSWRSLASAAGRSIKGYVAQRDVRRPFPASKELRPDVSDPNARSSWGQWAGQKLRTLGQGEEGTNITVEKLLLFPGWACRKYTQPSGAATQDPVPFDVELFISGFASRSSGVGFGSRAGRAFLRLAKSYAALPKLAVAMAPEEVTTPSINDIPSSKSEENLLASLHLPAKPDDMTEEAEMAALNEHLQQFDMDSASQKESSASSYRSGSPPEPSPISPSYPQSNLSAINLHQLHANLEARLFPFWASALGSRGVRVSVYASDPTAYETYKSPPLGDNYGEDENPIHQRPIVTQEILTAADGSFQMRLPLPWEKICIHPAALQIAFGDADREYNLFVVAELLPGPSRPATPTAGQVSYAVRAPRIHRNVSPTATNSLVIPLTHSTVRLISDIDDTIKLSGVLSGARAAFHNVMAKDLSDSVIPGMGDWYTEMWRHGVRFHYVSNSPFELLPVINEFIQLSRLPPGSVKLKSYAGRSLFNGLLSAPAERKRTGMLDVLDSFADAQFFLVGDSGEQDMELYASLARDRPRQILAVFIRDANNRDLVKPLEDPTGEQVWRSPPSMNTGNGDSRSSSSTIGGGQSTLTPSTYTAHRLASKSVSDVTTPPPRLYAARQPKRTRSLASPPLAKEGNDYFTSHLILDAPISEEPATIPPPSYPPSSFSRRVNNNNSGNQDSYFTSSARLSKGRTSTASSLKGAPQMTDAERKQYDLQMRVYRARLEMPEHIPLRVFREPSECVETEEILTRMNIVGRKQL